MAAPHRFRAKLKRPEGTGTWTLVPVPPAVTAALGTRGQVPVRGTLAGVAYRRLLMPDGDGGHFMPLNAELMEAAGVAAGDEADVTLEVDPEPRPVELPEELERALDAEPEARAAFDKMAPSHRREYAKYVAEAKKAETRERRAEKALGMILDAKRLK